MIPTQEAGVPSPAGRSPSKPRIWRPVTMLLALVLLASACGGSTSSGDPGTESPGSASPGSTAGEGDGEPFRVIAVLPLSGALSPQGIMSRAAIEVAADMINEAGGILGGTVEVEFLDSGTDPVQATDVLQEALATGSPPGLVIGGAYTAEVLATQPLINRNGLLSMGTSGSAEANDPVANPRHFAMNWGAWDNMAALRPVIEERGWDRLGVFFTNDALGESNLARIRQVIDGMDIELVDETFDPTASDLTASLDRLRAQEPDAVFFSAFGAPAGHVLDARDALGWDVPFVGDVAVVATDVAALVEEAALEGVELLSWKSSVDLPSEFRIFPDRWAEVFQTIQEEHYSGSIDGPYQFAANNFNAIPLAHAAATLAGSTDPDDMANALESYDELATEAGYEPFFINISEPGYTDSSHEFEAVDGDFVLVPAGPLDQGLIVSGGEVFSVPAPPPPPDS